MGLVWVMESIMCLNIILTFVYRTSTEVTSDQVLLVGTTCKAIAYSWAQEGRHWQQMVPKTVGDVHMCIHVCAHVCVPMCVQEVRCLRMWKPEVDVGHLLSLSTLFSYLRVCI